jgi:hypothetical protein
LLFADLFDKPVLARFDEQHASSDGGAILLKAADRQLGLLDRLAGCVRDDRQSGKVDHEFAELLAQRVYAIACGYEDTNDAARLGDDPIHKMKELHHGMQIDRTSCSRFLANQFRVLMTAAAYILMQELRLRLARTSCARAQVSTLRERFIKLGVHVVGSVRRIVLHLPASSPFLDVWNCAALSMGARAG